MPEYAVRRKLLAQDPLSSSQAFLAHVLVMLAGILGLRMCPDCPHCNAEDSRDADTKSSAGDKHETSRAKIQTEIDQLSQQLFNANKQKNN